MKYRFSKEAYVKSCIKSGTDTHIDDWVELCDGKEVIMKNECEGYCYVEEKNLSFAISKDWCEEIEEKPTKSAHEKLIERGFEYSYRELGEETCEKEHTFHHDKRHITIIVIVNGSSIGWYINFYDPYNYIADLELAKIIVQYLEEM